MWKSLRQQAYIKGEYSAFYKESPMEKSIIIGQSVCKILCFNYFFYRSIYAFLILLPLLWWFIRIEHIKRIDYKKAQLKRQFKEAILVIVANQKAGYSTEKAFCAAYQDMNHLFGEKSTICQILKHVEEGLKSNLPLEKLLQEIGQKSEIPDIMDFASVFAIAKHTGGNMTSIMEDTAAVIEDKLGTEQEIEELLSARKKEQQIMNAVPFAIMFYLSVTANGFFDMLYGNMAGALIMSVFLVIYLFAYVMSLRIVAIEI